MPRRAMVTFFALLVLGPLAGTHHPSAPRTAVSVGSHPLIPGGPSSGQTKNFGWASSNWSGYARTGGTGAFHSVTGRWTVASVSPTSKATYSSSWVGIDGFNNSHLIQTGTEADYYNGAAHYDAWWEILPAPETVIRGITVSPGNIMTATITKGSGSSWTITITDKSTGKSFSTIQQYTGPQTSAEWIEEAPSVNGHIATLAHYGAVKFDPGTVNGSNPKLVAAESGYMVQGGKRVSTPSNPDSDTDGFKCAYGSTQPAPPAS